MTGLMAPPLESAGPAPASKRATLLLSRGDRTPMTPSAATPGEMPAPVSVQAPAIESPVPDDAMLEVFQRKRPAGTEAGGEEASKTARLRRVAGEALAVNDEEILMPDEWEDLEFPSFLPRAMMCHRVVISVWDRQLTQSSMHGVLSR